MTRSAAHFEELFRSNYKSLCLAANRVIHDNDAAQDIVQDVFLKLWNKHEAPAAFSSIKGYLFRATINASIDYLESRKKVIRLDETELTLSVKPDENSSITDLENRISAAFEKLPPKCRAIFALSRFENLKYKEIAEHLGISVKTVENQMGIALERMREELKPYLTREFLAIAISTGISLLFHLLSVSLIILLFHRMF